jgi:hypothetical protein
MLKNPHTISIGTVSKRRWTSLGSVGNLLYRTSELLCIFAALLKLRLKNARRVFTAGIFQYE